MEAGLDTVLNALPAVGATQPDPHTTTATGNPTPSRRVQAPDTREVMDEDVFDEGEWVQDDASVTYLQNLTCKPAGHPHARHVPVTNTWVRAKFRDIPNHKRDRLLAGYAVEDAFPKYDIDDDQYGCLQVSKFKTGSSLAVQAAIRDHIRYMRSQPGSVAAFPTGRVSNARRQRFLDNRFDVENPDLGSNADACCADLDGSPCSEWNLTFIDSVAKSFVAAVRRGTYLDQDLPLEAKVERLVKKRVKTSLRSMIKRDRRFRRLNTLEALNHAKAMDKCMQRRRVKHHARLRTCDKSVKYRKYFALLKAVGPEGNSDEETDTEGDVIPLPIKVFPLRWRSKPYEQLLRNLDKEAQVTETHPLLRSGPRRASSDSARSIRPRVQAANGAGKIVPVSCPKGKPAQFYDRNYIRDAKAAGLFPHLRVGTAFVHALPRD